MVLLNSENSPLFADSEAGRDEMNLAEYPFAILRRNNKNANVIEHEWEALDPTKEKKIKCSWRVAGDPRLGLPTPSDERVYLVMMAITAEQGMTQIVNFTINNILLRLGWSRNSRNRQAVMNALNRLMAVTITATNCFYDIEKKATVDAGFHIISNYKIFNTDKSQEKLPPSYFRWDDDFFRSLESNYVKRLNLNFALSLKLPLSLRLYRYLDKRRNGGKIPLAIYREGVQNICIKHLGMTPNKFESKLKERLKKAHEELMEKGFLASVEYAPMKAKTGEMIIYHFTENIPEAETTTSTSHEYEDDQSYENDMEHRNACKTVWASLPEEERNQLKTSAEKYFADAPFQIENDAIIDPLRMASLKLWKLVEENYPDAVQKEMERRNT